jgi:hypothetical protein
MPEAEAKPEAKPEPKRGHPRVATVLVVVATILTFLGIFSVWINRQAFNTDNWVSTSDRILQNPDVQEQLSTFLANQLFDNVDVQAQIQATLPPKLAPLAGPAAGGLEQLVPQIAQRAMETSQFQTLWENANRAAHETFLNVVDGGTSNVSTSGGTVTLDLSSIVTQIGDQLGVGSAIASKLPADAGNIEILRSDQLSAAQDGASFVRHLPIVLIALILILDILALYLAGPRRRRTLRGIGIGFIVAGALVLVGRSLGGNAVVNSLASTEAVKPAVQATWDIGTSLLVTVAASALTFGILVVIGAWLAGPTRLATGIRRWGAPHVRDHRAGAYAVAGAVFLALVAWAPIAALRKPFGLLLFAVLLAIGAEVLRRQMLDEFGDAAPVGFPSIRRGGRDNLADLERLNALRSSGGLSDEEFAKAKAEILG